MTGRHVLGRHSSTWQVERFWEDPGVRGRPHIAAELGRV